MARWRDPMRPVELAIAGCQMAGVLGLFGGVLGMFVAISADVYLDPIMVAATVPTAGIGYLLISHYLGHGRRAAALGGFVLTIGVVLGPIVAIAIAAEQKAGRGEAGSLRMAMSGLLAWSVPCLGLGWLLVQLVRAALLLQSTMTEGRRGFEVLPVGEATITGGNHGDALSR